MFGAGGGDAQWEEEMEDGSKQPVLACQTVLVSPPGPAGSLMFTLLNILLTPCSVTVSNASSLLAGLSTEHYVPQRRHRSCYTQQPCCKHWLHSAYYPVVWCNYLFPLSLNKSFKWDHLELPKNIGSNQNLLSLFLLPSTKKNFTSISQ